MLQRLRRDLHIRNQLIDVSWSDNLGGFMVTRDVRETLSSRLELLTCTASAWSQLVRAPAERLPGHIC